MLLVTLDLFLPVVEFVWKWAGWGKGGARELVGIYSSLCEGRSVVARWHREASGCHMYVWW